MLKKILLAVGLLLVAATIYFAGPEKLAAVAASADPLKLFAAALVFIVVIALNAGKFHVLANAVGKTSFRETAKIVCFSQVVNQGTIALVGEATKSAMLKKLHDIPFSRALGVVALERVQDVFLLFVFSAFLFMSFEAGLASATILLIVAGLAAAAFFAFAPESAIKVVVPIQWARKNLLEFRWALHNVPKRAIMVSVLGAAAAFLVGGLANQLILSALGSNVDFMTVLAVTSAASLVGLLSALPAGLGAREVVLVGVYSQFGVSPSAAVTMSLIVRIIFSLESYAAYAFASKGEGKKK